LPAKGMRFLFLTEYFYPEVGAAQARLGSLVETLKRKGHDIEVVTAMPHHLTGQIFVGYRTSIYRCEDYKGITIHRTWILASQGTGLRRLLGYISFALTSLLGLFRCRRPDVVFVESPPLFLGIPAWLYARPRRIPIVFNVADLWPDAIKDLGVTNNRLLLGVAGALERWVYSKAAIINGITDGVYRTLLERKNIPRARLLLLPNGVDIRLFVPQPPDEMLSRTINPEGKHVMLYAGTHGIAHGMEVILEAAKQLQNEAILFLLVGGGSAKAKLVDYARRQHLRNVKFIDPVPQDKLPAYYSLAAASLVSLKISDTSLNVRPAKMFASLASGVPVIYSGEGEGADLLRQANAGIVTAPGDARELADAIQLLCHDGAARQKFGANGRAFVAREFSWDHIISRWLEDLTFSLEHTKT